MVLRKWDALPEEMKTPEVRKYYDVLSRKKCSLVIKRIFDIVVSAILIIMLFIPMLIMSVLIKIDSPGEVFFRQVRITAYGKEFRIHKFRTMVVNADKMGSLVTLGQDSRITRIGKFLRKYRLDEIPQLFDIILGNMTFVGTRPEVPRYVNEYSPEMYATLLLPAGVTSRASMLYKDEAEILENAKDVDKIYIEKVLPEKMKYNLEDIKEFNFLREIVVMIKTVFVTVFG